VAGVVTQVTDGDTLRFAPTGQAPITVRLRDVDAPEICQPWGTEARRALADLALNKPGTLYPGGRDAQGRTLALLTVDGVNISQRLVEEGHAWSLMGRNGHGPLLKQERMAQALSRGLHATPGAERPWAFVRSHGPCAAPP
jgi:endonuclease YncB( thermonuclease family)